MKKILSLVLCLMLTLSVCAFAEGSTTSATIVLSEIELNASNESLILNPAISVAFGSMENGIWLELGASIGGENVLVGQAELGNDELFASLDGANDTIRLIGVDALLQENDWDISTAEIIETVNLALGELTNEAIEDIASSSAESGLSVETLGDMDYRFFYEEDDISASFRMTVVLNAERSFNLSAKNVIEGDADMDTDVLLASDLLTVAMNGFQTLMADESVAQLVSIVETLFGLSEDTFNYAA